MAIRVGINGFGRIGRMVFRRMMEMNATAGSDVFEVVGINDLTDNKMLATLLKYDSIQGRFSGTVDSDAENIIVNGKAIKALEIRNPAELPWGAIGADYIIESTGIFRARETADKAGFDTHIKAGAKKVVISAPANDPDLTCVLGVNDDKLKAEHKCVSNASCTTNCLAPVAKIIYEKFGLVNGLMTTVHSYTNDQRILDFPHSDPYRARAAALNIIPTTTGAAAAVGLVLPEIAGKLSGFSLRVPTPTGSVVDLTVQTDKAVTKDAVNAAMKEAAEGSMKGVLAYTEDPIVLSDIVGDPHSSIFHGPWTMVMGDKMLKVMSWYDNEWGYSCRAADLLKMMAEM